MFKDVISTGWWRIHIILIFLPLIGGAIGLLDREKDFYYLLIWLSISYIIMLLFVVWVKRGFKKS